MSTKLVDMELDEISLVKKGANQHSVVSIAKSLHSEEEEMGNLFYEDGSEVDENDLAVGDVVFDEDGQGYEVTPVDDEDFDYEDFDGEDFDGDEVEKSFVRLRGAFNRGLKGGGATGGMGFAEKASNAAGRFGGGVKYAGAKARNMASTAAAGNGGQGTARRAANAAMYGAQDAAGRVTGAAGAAGAHIGRNKLAYGIGGGALAAGGVGGGAYAYNKNRNVAKSLREEFSKALTDGDRDDIISKAFGEIEQLQHQADEAAEIAKSEQELRIYNEYVTLAKSYTLPFSDEELALAMMEVEASVSPQTADVIAKSLEIASNAITNEIGFDGIGSDHSTPVDYALEEIGKSGDLDAYVAAMEANPDVYDQYLADRR